MKISTVIITLNEERNIRRCLDSVRSVSDEIIVIDSFSTDATKSICEEYQDVRFIQKEWMGYSATKNYGHSIACQNYVLSIDADEALSEELMRSIEALKVAGAGEGTVYQMNRLTNYCGHWVKHCGWYPDRKVRLFPKEVKWEGEIHEELDLNNLKVKALEGHLLHYSYYDLKDHRERADKYSRLTAKKMAERGKRAGILKPYLSAAIKFLNVYISKLGFLDGWAGWQIARISAISNILKYKELRRLTKSNE